jgi:HlyD family secretion protein
MWRAAVMTAVLGFVVVGLTAANLARVPGSVSLDWQLIKPPALEVQVETPGRGAIVQTITAPGKVETKLEAEIASQLVGRVAQVLIKEGDHVKEHQALVTLEQFDAKARVDSALAHVNRADWAVKQSKNDLEKAQRDARQSGTLAGRGFSTPTELLDARTALTKAENAVQISHRESDESKAMLDTATRELDHTTIYSEIDGYVSGVNVDKGEVVIAGTINLPGSVLMTVSNLELENMRVRAEVDETDVTLVHQGQPAQIFLQADPLKPIPGEVMSNGVASKGKVKNDVVSFETLIQVDVKKWSPPTSEPLLKPGMTATVEIEVKRASDALGVPAHAVVHRRRKDLPDTSAVRAWAARNARSPGEKAQEAELRYVKIVFVLEGDVARARPVETGLSDERRVEILSGLKFDERVVVGPFRALDELKDGQTVKVVTTPTATAPTGRSR